MHLLSSFCSIDICCCHSCGNSTEAKWLVVTGSHHKSLRQSANKSSVLYTSDIPEQSALGRGDTALFAVRNITSSVIEPLLSLTYFQRSKNICILI